MGSPSSAPISIGRALCPLTSAQVRARVAPRSFTRPMSGRRSSPVYFTARYSANQHSTSSWKAPTGTPSDTSRRSRCTFSIVAGSWVLSVSRLLPASMVAPLIRSVTSSGRLSTSSCGCATMSTIVRSVALARLLSNRAGPASRASSTGSVISGGALVGSDLATRSLLLLQNGELGSSGR
jgi:hypothetical protein